MVTRGATRNRGEKEGIVRTRSQLREPQRTQERRVKGSVEAQSQVAVAGCKSQFAVRSTQAQFAVVVRKSQVTLLDAVANQTLTLRGNECLVFVEVQKGLYTKVRDYVPRNPEHIRDILLYFPTSSCVN